MRGLKRRLRQAVKVARALQQQSWRRALFFGTAPATEHLKLVELSPVLSVIDVGANRGQFALVAGVLFPEAHLWCIEPLPEPRAIAERTLQPFKKRLTIIECALGSESAAGEMRVTSRDDSSSILPMTARQATFGGGLKEVRRHLVDIRRLDEVIEADSLRQPSLLKIDVQGYELEVLKGASGILHRLDYIYVECSFVELYAGQASADEVSAFAESHGFVLVESRNQAAGEDGEILQADLLFRRAGGSLGR